MTDEAVMACPGVEHVFIARRTKVKIPFYPPRDIWLDEAMEGERIFAYVILKEGYEADEELAGELRNEVRRHIGAFSTPDMILIAPGLPKTRSGKIMRRILRKIASGETGDLGDVTTLADPGIVDVLIDLRAELG
jgi:acetyl-CoA synthetase